MLRLLRQSIDQSDQTTTHVAVSALQAPEPCGETAGKLLNFEARTPIVVDIARSRTVETGTGRTDLAECKARSLSDRTRDRDQEIDLLGLTSVSPATFSEAQKRIADRPAELPFAYVVTPNAHHMAMLNRAESPLHAAYDAAWLRLCDSQILRAICWLVSGARLNLITGSDLTLSLLRHVLQPSDRVTIIGGAPELISALRDQFGLRNIAQHIPPMGYSANPDDVQQCVDFVVAHPARFTFVITGAPQSESLARRIAQAGGAKGIGLCVGSALDFATGRALRAPKLIRVCGVEWLFRLLTNPKRLIRRYVIESPLVFLLAARWWVSLRKPRRS